MSNGGSPRKWNRTGKSSAVVNVLTHIISQPPAIGLRCLEQDSYVRQLFEDPAIGNIGVPGNIKIVFLPTGERDKEDKGSIVVELPPVEAPQFNPRQLLEDCVRYAEGIPPTDPRTWDKNGKPLAIMDVLSHIVAHPGIREYCLNNESYSRQLFQDAKIGNIKVPDDVKIVFVPTGEHESLEFGSLIIELPSSGMKLPSALPNEPHPLLAYVLCCYHLW